MRESLKVPPKHVAFIMDGNGRWAREKGLSRTAGHRKGVERVREIIRGASELGIRAVTFFAFSTENWNRPKGEISVLMRYLDHFLEKEIKALHENNMRFTVIGRGDPVPKYLQKRIINAQEKTAGNTGLRVVLAINYGGVRRLRMPLKSLPV